MRDVIRLGLILLIITSIAAVILGISNDITSEIIADVRAEASNEARLEVLPQADKFEALSEEEFNKIKSNNDKVLEIYGGYKGDNLVGYAIKTATPGYGGDIEVITGLSLEGKVTGIKVVNHAETPGLGANATKPEFQGQYKNKPVDKEIVVVKSAPSNDNEIQALTGATISSNAVTNGVNISREVFNNELSK